MATINATLSVTSDITSSGLSIRDTMTMTNAGTSTGLEKTTGLARRFFTSTNQVDLLTATSGIAVDIPTDKFSAKLYAGEWMMIPWDAVSATGDITIQPSAATEMIVEYQVFFE